MHHEILPLVLMNCYEICLPIDNGGLGHTLQGPLERLSVAALIEWGTYFTWRAPMKIEPPEPYFHVILGPGAPSLRGPVFI